jgi:hypothetical protein
MLSPVMLVPAAANPVLRDLANRVLTTVLETRRQSWIPARSETASWQPRRPMMDWAGPAQPPEKRKVGGSTPPLTTPTRSSRFSRGPCLRLSLAPPTGCHRAGPGQMHPTFPRRRPPQLRTKSPTCGLAALSPWAGSEHGRIHAGQAKREDLTTTGSAKSRALPAETR